MEASTALLILAAVAPFLIMLFRFIMRSLIHPNSHVDDGAINKEELSIVESSVSTIAPAPYPPPISKYDVFLSFRGEDTRDTITSHLHDALGRAKIDTYIDYRLERGGVISPSLLKAIEESQIFVIIFSQDYASSTWCLDELVKILECKEKDGRVVIPVFYNIDPSDVRKQSGTYADAFRKHEKRFNGDRDKVQEWKDALFQAASLSGWDSTKTRPEAELISEIVKDISKKLNRVSSCNLEGLVGIHKHIARMEELLSIESPDVRIVGIWGMGGIGKTTIADVIFHRLKAQFESCSFVSNVRERLARNGLECLQKECLTELLGKGFGSYGIRSTFVKSRLQSKKILLVLDDVDNSIQGDDLINVSHCVGQGSRIIITSRDSYVLMNAGAKEIYHLQEMDHNDAVHLFSLTAFKKNQPEKDYVELSESVVDYYGGIPSVLIVLGSFLYGRRKEEWRSVLAELENAPDEKIFVALKISFDGLEAAQKDIFLDLACFFLIRRERLPKKQDMSNYYEFPEAHISVLIERSLISVDAYDQISMHDVLRAMGQEISQQLRKTPGEPIRLWKCEDIYRALSNNAETERIRSIILVLDICKKNIVLHPTIFQNMYNMRFLEVYKFDREEPSRLHIPQGLENFPEELRILCWDDYPLPSLPLRSCAKNLVKLKMSHSRLERLWDGDLVLPNLKIIDLWNCHHLIELPNLSQAYNIKELHLCWCPSLVRLYCSSSLLKLWSLSIRVCDTLMTMEFAPINCKVFQWDRYPLRSLPLSICSKNLVELHLPHSNLEQLWDGDQHLPSLKEIYLEDSKQLVGLPDLSQAPNIERLTLDGCSGLVQVYSSSFLYKLDYIYLRGCHKLRRLHLARNIHWRSSVLVACCSQFDLDNFSLNKVNVSLSVPSPNNKPVLKLKVVSVPYTQISECMDSVQSAELQLLRKTLASSLPYLSSLRWLHFPSSIGQFNHQFQLRASLGTQLFNHRLKETQLELLRTSSKILKPTESVTLYPCIKESAIKEVSSPLEELTDSENLLESSVTSFDRLLKVPSDISYFSFITELTLQKSDIVSAPAIIPGFSSLISLDACDCKSQAPIMDLSISEDSEGSMYIGYANESTYIHFLFSAFGIFYNYGRH